MTCHAGRVWDPDTQESQATRPEDLRSAAVSVLSVGFVIFFVGVLAFLAYSLPPLVKPLLVGAGTSWEKVLPKGVPAPSKFGSIAGVIATGTRVRPSAAGSKERLWIAFDEQHVAAMRFGHRGPDEPLILAKRSASPVLVSDGRIRRTVDFGDGAIRIRAPRTTTDPLVRDLRERGWKVRSPDDLRGA